MAQLTIKQPDCLNAIAVSAVINNFSHFKGEIRSVPDNVLFDLYFKLYKEKRLCLLGVELMDLTVFMRMLKVTDRKLDLHRCFQALMEHGTQVAKDLSLAYQRLCSNCDKTNVNEVQAMMEQGLKLGGFLSDAGWFSDSERVLQGVKNLAEYTDQSPFCLRKRLECCHRLLHTQTSCCNFAGAAVTHKLAEELVIKLQNSEEPPNLAGLYAEFSTLHFSRSEYDEAYAWSLKALREVVPGLPIRTTIDVLRQVSRSCVVKREFKKAGLLASQAVYLCKVAFGSDHPKFSDCLLDLGYYLLNNDSFRQTVVVYQNALAIRRAIFGKDNLLVAVAHEDLAYALYVHEYSSGRFTEARHNAEKAISVMKALMPDDHLMHSSGKRVKALILEEIALDTDHTDGKKKRYLEEAEALHLSALTLATATFGERNVQTAKHYGNIGRLYQSMMRFKEAEEMHLKAIAIKEELLGPDDYEVGLSVGHLASLYNYHMYKHEEAKVLYFRSIKISLKLFGESYSGLEYDYRGLVHVYESLGDTRNIAKYFAVLNSWKLSRELMTQKQEAVVDLNKVPCSIQDITAQFFTM